MDTVPGGAVAAILSPALIARALAYWVPIALLLLVSLQIEVEHEGKKIDLQVGLWARSALLHPVRLPFSTRPLPLIS